MRFFDEDEQQERDCGHQYPWCTNELCGTICKHDVRECGCYILKCDIDDEYCDNDCKEHIDNKMRQQGKELLGILLDAMNNIKKAYEFLKEQKQ